MRIAFLSVASLIGLSGAALAPYPSSESSVSNVFAIAEQGRSNAELLCLDTLAGNLARKSPRLYRVASSSWAGDTGDSYSVWLHDLRANHGVTVDGSLLGSSLQAIVQHFQDEVTGYARCTAGEEASSSAAITFAAAGSGILVCSDDATCNALDAGGVKMVKDLRGKKLKDILADALPQLSSRVFIFQDASKSQFLGDYAVFARAAYLQWSTDATSQTTLLSRAEGVGVAFGWGPENEYVSTLNKYGVYVHASDFNKNFAALSNVKTSGRIKRSAPVMPNASANVHTVAFLMSDGDNMQWTLGPWSTDAKWYGNSKRGSVPVGWTFSPATALVAPSALQKVTSSLTANDELAAGPSGVGYAYPTTFKQSSTADFVQLTHDTMKDANMRIINIIGQGDDPPSLRNSSAFFASRARHQIFPKSLLDPYLKDDQVDGMAYYPFGDGYAGLHGGVWFIDGKPVVSARYSLWGEATSGDMLSVKALASKLQTLPKTASSTDGYSLISVHAWSHTYDDIASVVAELQAAGGFEVVLPSELIRRVKANVDPTSALTCHCNKEEAKSPDNGFTCSDTSKDAYCSSDQVCGADGEWKYPPDDWNAVCKSASDVTCHCNSEGKTSPNNGFTCSDTSKSAYCSSDQACSADGDWAFPPTDWSSICKSSTAAFV